MNRRKVKGTKEGNDGKGRPSNKFIESKDLERNLLLEISKELTETKDKNRKNSSSNNQNKK